MLQIWKDNAARKRGERIAAKMIADIKSGYLSKEQFHKDYREYSDRHQLHRGNPFTEAFEGRWAKEGANDALQGVCKRQLYDFRAYDIGWSSTYEDLTGRGWNHAALKPIHDEMLARQTAHTDGHQRDLLRKFFQ